MPFPDPIAVLDDCFFISDHGIVYSDAVFHGNVESGHFYSLNSMPQTPFDFVVKESAENQKAISVITVAHRRGNDRYCHLSNE